MASKRPRSDLRAAAIGRALDTLAGRDLPEVLPGLRWFGSKGRRIARVAALDRGPLGPGVEGPWLLLAEVSFSSGPPESYVLPLALRRTEPEGAPPWGRVGSGRTALGVYDGLDDRATCLALLAALERADSLPLTRGIVQCSRTEAFPATAGQVKSARRLTSEQSNTSVVFDRSLIMKVFRKFEPGLNPDCEVTGFLTTRTAFRHVPLLAGAIDYAGPGDLRGTLAMLQHLIVNQGDGWRYATDHLARLFEFVAERTRAQVASSGRPVQLVREFSAGMFRALRRLGELTGGLHAALASAKDEPAFTPEAIGPADVARWGEHVTAQATAALRALRDHLGTLGEDARADAEAVLEAGDDVSALVGQLDLLVSGRCEKVRIHGDYHLGQTLRTEDDFVLFDFEGEPARPLAERRAKHCALKDVAGMLRSLDYAATSAARAVTDAPEGLGGWAGTWVQTARQAFLDGYVGTTGDSAARLHPPEPDRFASVVAVFELDKAFYELAYELNNRPSWVGIPLRGLRRILAPEAGPAPK